jgi:hypothetical protein
MAGVPKPGPLQAFQDNMRDAHHLVSLAEGLTNVRVRRMRKELRQRVGEAWRVPVRDRDALDCIESKAMYLTFKPGSNLSRDSFSDHRPLLRQSLVAACAATETYLADKVMSRIGALTHSPATATKRLSELTMTVGDWLQIEQDYTRRRWGLHHLIEKQVREAASTAPSRVGELLSLAGVSSPQKALDKQRAVAKGDTEALLARITERRNKIVHTGDRQGRNRASLTLDEVKRDLAGLESLVAAIEELL